MDRDPSLAQNEAQTKAKMHLYILLYTRQNAFAFWRRRISSLKNAVFTLALRQVLRDTYESLSVVETSLSLLFGKRFFDGASLAQNDDLLSATIIIIAIANAILSYRKVYPCGYGYNSPPFTRRKYTSAFTLSLGLHTERRSKTVVEVSLISSHT